MIEKLTTYAWQNFGTEFWIYELVTELCSLVTELCNLATEYIELWQSICQLQSQNSDQEEAESFHFFLKFFTS